MIHELKTEYSPLCSVSLDKKRAEFRKNDRNFKEGDVLVLREYDPLQGYSGTYELRKITHVQEGYGIPKGYAMLSIRPLTKDEEAAHAAGGA